MPKNKNNKKSAKVAVVVSTTKKPIKPRKKKNKNKILVASINPNNMFASRASSFLNQYVNTVCDPWEHGPLKLGYDCMVNTVLATGFYRSSLTVNATDGSFAIACFPSCNSCIWTYTAGLSSATTGQFNCQNATGITTQLTTARVVSGGIRAFALFPETSAPGVLYAGIVPSITATALATFTTSSYSNLPGSELGIGTKGARSCILPLDNNSFQFNTLTLGSYPSNNLVSIPSAVPFIMGQGFPAGTTIWYEFIINLEGIESSATVNTVGINPEAPSDVASNHFATPERLYSAARAIMGSTTVMDGVQNLASRLNPSVGQAIGLARSAFGYGRNLRNSLLASGRDSARISNQNSIVIEEMKEEYQLVPRKR